MKPQLAINELARVAKKNSYIIVSLDTKFIRIPEYIERGWIKEAKKLLTTNISNELGFPQCNLTWEELAEFYETANIEVIEAVRSPVFMHLINEKKLSSITMDPKIRAQLLKIELENCTNKTLINFAGHLQMIGIKK